MQLNIVIPVYNEEAVISQTYQRLRIVSERLVAECGYTTVTLVFVNDGSRDRTSEELEKLTLSLVPRWFKVEVLHFSRNFGHSAAVFAGIENATGDRIAIIDADLQDPPECLIEMSHLMDSSRADVVYGKRRLRKGESLFKKATAWAFYRVINFLSGFSIPKDTGDFRIMTREVRDAVVKLSESEPFLRGLVAWVGFSQLPYEYDRQSRTLGETKYPFRKMVAFATHAIMSFSSVPLRIAFYLGTVGILFSALLSLHAFHVWLSGTAIPGWTSLIIGLSFGQSINLLLIGVVGLYLGRVHTASQNRPRYLIKKSKLQPVASISEDEELSVKKSF